LNDPHHALTLLSFPAPRAAQVRLRLETAKQELTYAVKPGYFDVVLVNDDLEVSCAAAANLTAEESGLAQDV
jgi:guanylate kinase